LLGVIRVDCCGALMLSNAGQVASIEAETIRYANELVYRRGGRASRSLPVWGLTAGSIVQWASSP
jgi:hypothetical protein